MADELRVDVPPRISRDGAVEVLRGSPMAEFAGVIYDYAAGAGIDPAYILAIAKKETQYGREGVGRDPQCNAWAIRDHGWGRGFDGPGGFSWYASYFTAAQDAIDLLTDTGSRHGRALYFKDGLRTVETITPRYAPPGENATFTYIRQVRETVAALALAYPPGAGDAPPPPVVEPVTRAEYEELRARVDRLEARAGVDSMPGLDYEAAGVSP